MLQNTKRAARIFAPSLVISILGIAPLAEAAESREDQRTYRFTSLDRMEPYSAADISFNSTPMSVGGEKVPAFLLTASANRWATEKWGYYAQLPIAYTRMKNYDQDGYRVGESFPVVYPGNLEIGGTLLLPRWADVIFRAGLDIPIGPESEMKRDSLQRSSLGRITDIGSFYWDNPTLRLSLSIKGVSDRFYGRLDLGFDTFLESNGKPAGFPLPRINAALGVKMGESAITTELVVLVPLGMSVAVTYRLRVGSFTPHAGIVLPIRSYRPHLLPTVLVMGVGL